MSTNINDYIKKNTTLTDADFNGLTFYKLSDAFLEIIKELTDGDVSNFSRDDNRIIANIKMVPNENVKRTKKGARVNFNLPIMLTIDKHALEDAYFNDVEYRFSLDHFIYKVVADKLAELAYIKFMKRANGKALDYSNSQFTNLVVNWRDNFKVSGFGELWDYKQIN